jgi:hypothetical protein
MPVTYTIDSRAGLIRTRCFGNVTLPEVLDHFRELREDPTCPDRLDVLLDLTEESSLPDTRQLRTVADELARVRGKIRLEHCAVIAQKDVLFGMLRMFEVMTQDYFRDMRVFRTAVDAEIWLAGQRSSAEPASRR